MISPVHLLFTGEPLCYGLAGTAINSHRTLLGDSLAVELAALTRAALVQIQVPQPLPLISMYPAVGFLPPRCKVPGCRV